jgi:malonate-semialdehyde dehydrogenase (acetylating)/methylmalonate-semialdehyde dehydrogenase
VLSVIRADSLDEAIEMVNRSAYGNMSCLFTSSGSAARRFRHEVRTGNVGINLGVAAPMAYFPFSGWKESFFGDLHAQGSDAGRFLYGEESDRGTMAVRLEPEVLAVKSPSEKI